MSQMLSSVRAILGNLDMDDSPIITIHCDGGDISVKKFLLTETSDVFKAMFASNMLETYTNVVSAKDIDFETMKTIIDYYDKGVVTDVPNIDEIAFSYIVEKYNFVGIKEAVAETLLDSYKKEEDLEILEKIFTTYNGHAQKATAVVEIANMIAKGKNYPNFVTNLNPQDFLELSKSCCSILRGNDAPKWAEYLKLFKSWARQNSRAESVVVLEIIGMIDIRQFPASDVLEILQFSTLNKELERFKLMFEKALTYIIDVIDAAKTNKKLLDICPCGYMECEDCGHRSSKHPFHRNPRCQGKHACISSRCIEIMHQRSGGKHNCCCKHNTSKSSYKQRIPYGFEDDIFGSLTLTDVYSEFSTLNKELEPFKLMFEKALTYIVDVIDASKANKKLLDICPCGSMECEDCGHISWKHPFHRNTRCQGKHACTSSRCIEIMHQRSGRKHNCCCKHNTRKSSYKQRIPYGFEDDIFGSLTLTD